MFKIESLSSIVYKSIDEEYGWGTYCGLSILIRKTNGFVNVSRLCQDGGKNLKHWNENASSKKLIEELVSEVGSFSGF